MGEDIKKLMELLKNPALSNSVRLGALISLYMVKRTTFASLQSSTGISKSSLYMHLQVLEEHGLIKVKKVLTALGPRTVIEITEKGEEVVKEYMDVIRGVK